MRTFWRVVRKVQLGVWIVVLLGSLTIPIYNTAAGADCVDPVDFCTDMCRSIHYKYSSMVMKCSAKADCIGSATGLTECYNKASAKCQAHQAKLTKNGCTCDQLEPEQSCIN